MSKDVKFNIKLSIDGKEHIVEATTDVKHFAQELGIAETKGKRLRDSLLKFNGLVTMFRSSRKSVGISFPISRGIPTFALWKRINWNCLRVSCCLQKYWIILR